MTPARPTAILFDLWGTLVPPRPDRRDADFAGPETGRLRDLVASPWLGVAAA